MRFIEFIKDYINKLKMINKERLKKFVLSVPFWVMMVALFLIIFGSVRASLAYNRPDHDMAALWSQGSTIPYRHMVVYARGAQAGDTNSPMLYVDENTSLRKADIITIRNSLQAVVDAGREDKKNPGLDTDGSPKYWEDCYSTEFNDVVTYYAEDSQIAPTVDANIIAVGGNYKAFHPFIYLSGGFLADNCVDMNQIVINDVLAWRFFHSYDVVGYKINLMGEDFVISGVVRENDSKIDNTAGTNVARCYMYFSALENYYFNSDGEGSEDMDSSIGVAITCYEAMLPELVVGVAQNDFKTALPTYTDQNPQMYVVSMTGRYNIFKVFDHMLPIGETTAKLTPYSFPYWERASQLTIENLFVDAIFIIVGAVLLFVGIIMIVLKSRKFRKITLEPVNLIEAQNSAK